MQCLNVIFRQFKSIVRERKKVAALKACYQISTLHTVATYAKYVFKNQIITTKKLIILSNPGRCHRLSLLTRTLLNLVS